MTKTFQHPESHPATRLDAFLAQSMGLGLRQCRALIADGRVLVDGRPLAKGAMVRPGQRVSVGEAAVASAATQPDVAVLARDDRFVASVTREEGDAPFVVAYTVRAVSPGSFHHPAASVEDMYRPDYRAQTDAGRVVIAE